MSIPFFTARLRNAVVLGRYVPALSPIAEPRKLRPSFDPLYNPVARSLPSALYYDSLAAHASSVTAGVLTGTHASLSGYSTGQFKGTTTGGLLSSGWLRRVLVRRGWADL